MAKKFMLLFMLFISCGADASLDFDKEPCPLIDVRAQCFQGVWKIEVASLDLWSLMGDGANGQPCLEGETSTKTKWNYAAFHGRIGAMCNFSLLNSKDAVVGPIQLRSRSFLSGSQNWRQGAYPGHKTCDIAREDCLFLKIPG